MNNSKIAYDDMTLSLETPVIDTEHLREKEAQAVRIIEAIERIKDSEEWSSLKSLIFASLAENLEKKLKFEAEKMELDNPTIYRLQGQLLWARKYADLAKLAESYRIELSNIRKQLPKGADLTQPTER